MPRKKKNFADLGEAQCSGPNTGPPLLPPYSGGGSPLGPGGRTTPGKGVSLGPSGRRTPGGKAQLGPSPAQPSLGASPEQASLLGPPKKKRGKKRDPPEMELAVGGVVGAEGDNKSDYDKIEEPVKDDTEPTFKAGDKSKRNKMIAAGVGVVLLVGIIVAIILATASSGDDDEEQAAPATPAPDMAAADGTPADDGAGAATPDAFARMDTDSTKSLALDDPNKLLTKAELRAGIEAEWGRTFSDPEFEEIFQRTDSDGSGAVSLAEFQQMDLDPPTTTTSTTRAPTKEGATFPPSSAPITLTTTPTKEGATFAPAKAGAAPPAGPVPAVPAGSQAPTKEGQTFAPSVAPTTMSPTEEGATMGPSVTPTRAPSVAPTKRCTEAVEGVNMTATEAPILCVNITAPGVLTTLTCFSYDGVQLPRAPAGRSYDGNAWEAVYPRLFPFNCSDGASYCETAIPADGTCDIFRVESITPSVRTDEQLNARFLMQATFGQTRDSLDAMTGDYKQWIIDQEALPPSLHRAHYRSRANPRLLAPIATGGVRTACEENSRWHRFAFNVEDVGEKLAKQGGTPKTLTVTRGGVAAEARTEVSAWPDQTDKNFKLIDPPTPVDLTGGATICKVVEAVGGEVTVSLDNCKNDEQKFPNPAITFTAQPTGCVTGASFGEMVPPAPTMTTSGIVDAKLLKTPGTCSAGDVWALDGGEYYRYDPRLLLVKNTVQDPAAAPAAVGQSCPTVAKTFVNEATCVTGRSSCSPLVYNSKMIKLDKQTLTDWYEIGGKILYWVSGLRTDSEAKTSGSLKSPCEKNKVSRWKRQTCSGSQWNAPADTFNAITAAIDRATVKPGSYESIIDIVVTDTCTTSNYHAAGKEIGPYPATGTKCYLHVHQNYNNVYDFTGWSLAHPGNKVAIDAGHPNPILQYIMKGTPQVELPFPSFHTTKRWKDKHAMLGTPLGVYNEEVDFMDLPSAVQNAAIATHLGAGAGQQAAVGAEACGSPGEVENNAELGARYTMYMASFDDVGMQVLDQTGDSSRGDTMIWTQVNLFSPDQLRQRVAWALAQTLVMSEEGGVDKGGEMDTYTAYYDIFVRHALGNYRDVMREVSYSPMMARMLTFIGSKSWAKEKEYPDENYAREVMQLFSIGLWRLNADGTLLLDADGKPVPTYDQNDVLTFARAWTGFDYRPARGNIENPSGDGSSNFIDPMQIKPDWRDVFPKMDLFGGYIGDGAPLCTDLPAKAFLREGARYRYLGTSPLPALQLDPARIAEEQHNSSWPRRLFLGQGSALRGELCGGAGACDFQPHVVLSATLTCDGDECDIDLPRVVGVDEGGGKPIIYYEYVRMPCVELAFVDSQSNYKIQNRAKQYAMCVDPRLPAAMPSCCDTAKQQNPPDGWSKWWEYTEPHNHLFHGERVTWATAEERCRAKDQYICNFVGVPSVSQGYTAAWDGLTLETTNTWKAYLWTNISCSVRVQVNIEGHVAIVHEPVSNQPGFTTPDTSALIQNPRGFADPRWRMWADNNKDFTAVDTYGYRDLTTRHSLNWFRVGWQGGSFPTVAAGCAATAQCEVDGETCVCNTTVATSVVFTAAPPSRAEAEARLTIGAVAPLPGDGLTKHPLSDGLFAHTAAAGAPTFDEATIFELTRDDGSASWFANKASTVELPGTGLSFRNPPSFMSLVEATTRDAEYETEAVLDHYFGHPNTAPFIGTRLINYFVTSNPSPRYVGVVAEAFRTGTYDGVGTGKRGDLLATVSAVLLDSEARSPTLDADPTFGVIREPIVKVLHFMRAMGFAPRNDTETLLMDMEDKIGMMAYHQPTVFNFYQSDYQPNGPIAQSGLVSQESQLLSSPFITGMMNGMASLSYYGLTSCDYGFGRNHGDLGYSNPSCKWASLTPMKEIGPVCPEMGVGEDCYDGASDYAMKVRTCGADGNTCCCKAKDPPLGFSTCSCWRMMAYHPTESHYWEDPAWFNLGALRWAPQSSATVQDVVDELDVLLTAGRLNSHARSVIADMYLKEQNGFVRLTQDEADAQPREVRGYLAGREGYHDRTVDPVRYSLGRQARTDQALNAAMLLVTAAPEFTATNLNRLTDTPRPPPPVPTSSGAGGAYKAIVFLMLAGAADSHSFIVPYDGCKKGGVAKDLYAEYKSVRGNVHIAKSKLQEIPVTGNTCTKFGVHESLVTVKELYDKGEAAFMANVGPLVEPITKQEFQDGAKRTPPSLFAHNIQQRSVMNLHAQSAPAKGILGRIADALNAKGIQTGATSIAGNVKAVEADSTPADIIHRSNGVIPFDKDQVRPGMVRAIENITDRLSHSLFAETWAASLRNTLDRAVVMGEALEANLTTSFPANTETDNQVGQQFEKVARIIAARDMLKRDRDLFYTSLGGFDTHGDTGATLKEKMKFIDNAIKSFQDEMDGQGLWNNVLFIVGSDFGRTLTSNGLGTDHAWAGNYFMVGGGLKKAVHGTYPDDLTDDGATNLGRGRVIPTTSWEEVWDPIAKWFGVVNGDMDAVLPNRVNFPNLIPQTDMFK